MNTNHDLTSYTGSNVTDDGELSSLEDIIQELTEFLSQFNMRVMSDHALYLNGKASAYQDVIDYLARIAPIKS